jgi:aerobic C4-dicarboxylate transport protein
MAESSGDSTTSGAPAPPAAAGQPGVKRKPLYHHLYFWVLLAIVAGAVVGVVAPSFAVELKPLADGFVKLIRMLIAPIIFTTVVVGIASLGNLAEAGRLGLKALGYFITMTLIALAIGLVVINLVEPGVGLNITPDPADAQETLGSRAGSSRSCCTSSPTPSSGPSPRARSSRYCSWPSSAASPSRRSASKAPGSWPGSTRSAR